MSKLKTNTIQHTGGSADNITLDNSQNVTVEGNLTVDGTLTAAQRSNRNLIINGAMEVDQRNGGSSITPTADGTYSVDRFKARLNVASKYSLQKVADGPSGFNSSLKITSAAATTPGTNDYYQVNHCIEGYNHSPLDLGLSTAKQFTLSFWVKSSLTGTFGGAYSNSVGNKFYAWTYTISSANTWEKKTITITGVTDGTWERTNGAGLYIYWTLGAGSGVQTSAGSWGTSFKRGPSGAVDVVATNAATWQITGVQLEVGSVATDFEHRSYGDELARCQRYYIQYDVNTGATWTARMNGSSNSDGYIDFPVEMRADPTGSVSFNTAVCEQGSTGKTVSGISATGYGKRMGHGRCSLSQSGTNGYASYNRLTGTSKLMFSAEL